MELALGRRRSTLHSTDPVVDGGQEGAATGSLRKPRLGAEGTHPGSIYHK